jgi:hypothetical protein
VDQRLALRSDGRNACYKEVRDPNRDGAEISDV